LALRPGQSGSDSFWYANPANASASNSATRLHPKFYRFVDSIKEDKQLERMRADSRPKTVGSNPEQKRKRDKGAAARKKKEGGNAGDPPDKDPPE
jgi:hypothetical protein